MHYLEIARELVARQQAEGRRDAPSPAPKPREALEAVLKGQAVALFSDLLGERFWIVIDEEDAALLVGQGERRGSIYTIEEARAITVIHDPEIAAEVHRVKRTFDRGRLSRK